MRPHLHTQIQVARRRAHRSGVAFARNAQPRTAGQSWRIPNFIGFRAAQEALAAASAARCANLSGAAAARAGNVEAHLARGLLDGSGAVANRASLRRTDRARTVAGFAGVEPRDLQLFHRAAHGIPKINFDLILQVAAGFLLLLHGPAAATAATEELAEEIAEAARAGAFASGTAKVASTTLEIHRGIIYDTYAYRPSSGIEIVAVKAVLVVHLPPLR